MVNTVMFGYSAGALHGLLSGIDVLNRLAPGQPLLYGGQQHNSHVKNIMVICSRSL